MKSNKTAVFRTPVAETKNVLAYNEVLTLWPTPYEELGISSDFGVTHMIASGPEDAEPIILLHGQYSTATSWTHLIPALCRNFRVFAIDTIGEIGKSKPSFLPKSRQDYRNWLCDIFDQLKIQKANLVGYSYGGFLAANFAIANPERVTRMILLAPGIPNLGAFTSPWAYYGLPMMILPSRFTIRRFINGASRKGYSTQNPIHEQMILGMTNMRKVSFLRPQFTDKELNKIVIPTLLMLGECEIMYEPRKALERATQLIANLQTELIPEAGHMLISDQPEVVSQSMLNFLQSVNLEHQPTSSEHRTLLKRRTIMNHIPDTHLDLIDGPYVVALSTIMPNDQPQTTPVWCNRKGDYIFINVMKGFRKEKNMRLNPNVSLLAYDLKNPLHNIEIRGLVIEMTEEGAAEHNDELAQLYLGKADAKFFGDAVPADLQARYTPVRVKICPTHIRVES